MTVGVRSATHAILTFVAARRYRILLPSQENYMHWLSMPEMIAIGILAFITSIFLLTLLIIRKRKREFDLENWPVVMLVYAAVVGGLTTVAVSIAFTSGIDTTDEMTRWVVNPRTGSHYGFFAMGVLLAIILFALRKYARIAYGGVEIAAGLLGLWIYPKAPPVAAQVLSVGSAAWLIGWLSLIYILIRGMDNVDVGFAARRKRREDRLKALEQVTVPLKAPV